MMHDHAQSRDHHANRIFTTCYCFCEECYSEPRRQTEGNGCICEECFCRDPEYLTPWVVIEPVEPARTVTKVENVVKDLPESPGKTGTCRTCKGPTFRKGDRGRFPVMCEGCK